ncbi:hypothetical protein GDO78_014178 [Eleutherodactylus coqui]|uniref:GED domain-containing protein n=1 Tax=Eleutherodactylus coqui TaxID=57060 RepID=A0A8J6EER9_ELECQ|nr:hypothetical protein GDO78_014178 [Eleutherodactylus coqui]
MDLPLYRGREPTGFVNYKTFENIARSQVQTFEEPAIDTLNEISELVRSTFNDIALKHFCHYHNLYSSAKGKLEEICSEQQKEAEKEIHRQFKREQIIYCRDNLYTAPQSYVQRNTSSTFFDQETLKTPKTNVEMSVELMSQHMQEYLKTMTARLSKQIPLIILHCMLHECADKLEAQMLLLLQDKENINMLLVEKEDLVRERQNLNDQIKRLQAAQKRVAKFPYK